MNNLTFKKLGLSEVEIETQARAGNRLDKRAAKAYRSMYETGNPTDEDIKELENVVGAVPEDYKAFLKSHNGGIPSATLLKTRFNERVINSLLALNAPPGFGDSIGTRMKIYDGRVPKKTFPIASAGGGDLVLLNTASGNLGEILYWDHNFESDEDDASDYFENTEVVADSFSEFLSKLTPDVE